MSGHAIETLAFDIGVPGVTATISTSYDIGWTWADLGDFFGSIRMVPRYGKSADAGGVYVPGDCKGHPGYLWTPPEDVDADQRKTLHDWVAGIACGEIAVCTVTVRCEAFGLTGEASIGMCEIGGYGSDEEQIRDVLTDGDDLKTEALQDLMDQLPEPDDLSRLRIALEEALAE